MQGAEAKLEVVWNGVREFVFQRGTVNSSFNECRGWKEKKYRMVFGQRSWKDKLPKSGFDVR